MLDTLLARGYRYSSDGIPQDLSGKQVAIFASILQVEKCTEHKADPWTITETAHSGTCVYCKTEVAEEAHVYDKDGIACTICGYSSVHTHSFGNWETSSAADVRTLTRACTCGQKQTISYTPEISVPYSHTEDIALTIQTRGFDSEVSYKWYTYKDTTSEWVPVIFTGNKAVITPPEAGKSIKYKAVVRTPGITAPELEFTITKALCTHENAAYAHIENTLTHTVACSDCGYRTEAEKCDFGGNGTCACGSTLAVTLPENLKLAYNGTAQTPAVTVTVDGRTLDEADYTVSYASNTKAGTAAVTVSGANFSGAVQTNFTIERAGLAITASAQTVTYGESITQGTDQVTAAGLCPGDTLQSVALAAAGTAITPSGAQIRNAGGEDVTESYNIIYQPGTLTVLKADQPKPPAPAAAGVTGASVTLAAVEHAEYSMDGVNWQDSPVFTGLSPNTAYTFYVRLKEDEGHNASPISDPASITTTEEIIYTVTVENDGNGTASASPASAAEGTVITLAAVPYSGYRFKEWWVVSGGAVINGSRFTMPAENVTVKAVFERDSEPDPPQPETYAVTVRTEGGGTASASPASATAGTVITLAAAPYSGYHFKEWQVISGGVTVSGGSFTMPAENVTVKAVFERDSEPDPPQPETYTVTVQTDGNGTASASPASAAEGTVIALTAAPDNGYHFKEWQVISGGVTVSGSSFTMPAENVTLKAVFEKGVILPDRPAGNNGEQLRLVMETGIDQVPVRLQNIEKLDTPAKLETVMRTEITQAAPGIPQANMAVYNVTLLVSTDGGATWTPATADNFPSGGLAVTLPYPSGTNSGFRFTVVHMFTTSDFGKRPGDTERPAVTNVENGIQFTVTGLSPISVGWTAPATDPGTPSGGGHGGGGGGWSASTYAVTVEKPEHGKVTSSRANASHNSTVTLTVTPDSGYVLDALTVTDSRGNELGLTDQGGGRYTFTMPSRAVTVKAVFAPLLGDTQKPCGGGADCPSRGFTDLGSVGTWYHEAVDYVLRSSLMSGYGNGTFGPNNNLSRAQFAQILFNMEGRPIVNYSLQYGDVAEDAWYTEAIRWAACQGIIGGYSGGMFGPNDSITREQLAVMLWRYAGSPAATDKELHFTDADKASGYALEALRWAVESGVMSGRGGGILDPKGLVTRAQAAQMLINFQEK